MPMAFVLPAWALNLGSYLLCAVVCYFLFSKPRSIITLVLLAIASAYLFGIYGFLGFLTIAAYVLLKPKPPGAARQPAVPEPAK